MKKLLVILIFVAMSTFGTTAGAVVIDFENLYSGIATTTQIPTGYEGFSWSESAYWIAEGYPSSPGSGYEYGTIGNVSLFTLNRNDISISLASGYFDFNGAYITSAWFDDQNVIVEGWQDGSISYTTTILTHDDNAYWFDFNYLNIDTLWFKPLAWTSSSGKSQIVIDNITYNETAPVPEPTTMLLFGLGLLGLSGVGRRKK